MLLDFTLQTQVPCKRRLCPSSSTAAGGAGRVPGPGGRGGQGTGWHQARPPRAVSTKEGLNNADLGRNNSLPPSHTGPVRARRAPPPAPQPSEGPGPAAEPDGRPHPARLPPPRPFGLSPHPATPRPGLTCASQRRSWLYRALPSRKPSRHTEYSCKHTAVRPEPAPGPAGPAARSPPRAHHVTPPAPLPQLLGGGDAEVQLHAEAVPSPHGSGEAEGGSGRRRRQRARRQGALPRASRRDGR